MQPPAWIREIEPEDGEVPHDTCELYKVFQDRQLWHLRLLCTYTNFHIGALSGLVTVFILGLVAQYDNPLIGLLSILPLSALLLLHNWRAMAWRFHRSYIEGRVKLTKLEYSMGLAGQLVVPCRQRETRVPWPKDSSLLPVRHFANYKRFF